MEILRMENYIQNVHKIKDTSLNLSHRCLTVIPSTLINLKWIHKLMLNNNKLLLAPEISELVELEELTLDHNMLTLLPNQIEKLQNLKRLICCHNPLGTVMPEIGYLHQLQELWLNACQLMFLPKEIGNLKNLCKFSAKVNKLNSIPETIGGLTKLHWINLSSNLVSDLPESFGQLQSLNHVNLSCNKFKTLPQCFLSLPQIMMLDLRGNEIADIPEDFLTALPNLNRLDLRENIIQKAPQLWQNVGYILTGKCEDDVILVDPNYFKIRKHKTHGSRREHSCSKTNICEEITNQTERNNTISIKDKDVAQTKVINDAFAENRGHISAISVKQDFAKTESAINNTNIKHRGSIIQIEANNVRTMENTKKLTSMSNVKENLLVQDESVNIEMGENKMNYFHILQNPEYKPP